MGGLNFPSEWITVQKNRWDVCETVIFNIPQWRYHICTKIVLRSNNLLLGVHVNRTVFYSHLRKVKL